MPDTHCPSCGRFAGAQETCPYCGARLSRRLSLRLVRYGAVVLAVLGLLALWGAARAKDIPVVRIQDISSTMNWAYVRLRGTVTRPPTFDDQTGYLKFWLYDGSGEMMIAAYGNESQALMAAGKTPAMGDVVTVEGTLKVKEDFQSLTLNVPDHCVVERPQPAEAAIKDVTIERIYEKVLVKGEVREVRQPYEGLTILTIRDQSGDIDVTYTADLVRLSGQPAQIVPGEAVSVRGAVSLYGETPQLALDAADGLQKLPQGIDIAPEKAIQDIQTADVGQMVRIKGAITEIKGMAAGQRLTLDDGTASLTVVLWQDVIEGLLDRADLKAGSWLDVRGIVSEYKGALEVAPELPLDVQIVRAQPVEVTRLPLAAIAVEHKKQTISTEGQIVRISPFSAGQKLTLQEGQARLTLVFWQDLFDACPGKASLAPGAWVSVQGQIEEYQAEIEIIPGHAEDVVFLKMGELPGAERQAISAITRDHVGQFDEIEGQITAVNPFTKGVRWTVNDGTGSIVVLVWENVIAPLSMTGSPSIFDVGARVRVSGEVQVYRDTLEIVPAVPADIRWLAGSAPAPAPTATVTTTLAPTSTPMATAAPAATPRPGPAASPTPGLSLAPTGKLGEAQVGQRTAIQGTVVESTAFSTGLKLYLDDGSGRAVLWIPQELVVRLANAAQLAVGSTVRGAGEVQEYKGEKEIVPQAVGDVVVLAAATPPAVTVVRLADLSAADKGKTVTVEGAIVEVRPFSQGMKYVLDDGSGRITLLLWQNIYDQAPDKEKLVVGVNVRAAGQVDEYKGEIEVIPGAGKDVTVK